MNSIISVFKDTFDLIPQKDIDMDMFLDFIKDGQWQDLVLKIRAEPSKEKRDELKKKVPAVTISGRFSERKDACLVAHSNYLAIDFDNLDDPEEFKNTISNDKYCYAIFRSISGRGLCMIVKIDGTRHKDAFEGIQQYIYDQYNEIISFDRSVKNESRLRYISFDPHIVVNKSSLKFTKYVVKQIPKKIENIVFVESDFKEMMQEVESRHLNICDSYSEWLRCGLSLAEKFGENGRGYFHILSQSSLKYDPAQCDKQYTHCVNARGTGITINTLYYYLSKAGIKKYSKKTELVASISSAAQKGGKSKDDTIENLIKHEGLKREDVESIVNQVFDNRIDISSDTSIIYDIQNWLRHNYDLKLNTITQYLENKGKQVDDVAYNSIFVQAKIVFDRDAPTNLIKEILGSDFITCYNPITDFFKNNTHRIPKFLPREVPKIILDLWNTVETDNKKLLIKYGTKWLVSIIAAAHYHRSELMLIFTGEQNVGKSQFFIRLFPEELQKYFGMPSQMKDTDLHIAMGQKLLMLDDEVSGKSKKEDHVMKKLLSAPFFTLRKPYGSANVDVKRLAVWCGTSNPNEVLTDPTGNRRFLPFRMISQNFEAYNEIDKTELFMAAYQMWKDGFNWEVTKEDMVELRSTNTRFEAHSSEYELLCKYFQKGRDLWTATDIKVFLEKETGLRLSKIIIGQELQKMKIELTTEDVDGKPKKVYLLDKQTFNNNPIQDKPF